MIEVRIITTVGCEGCRIMEKIVQDVIKNFDYNEIEYAMYDFQYLGDNMLHFVNRYQVNDFPATFIIKNNEVVDRIFGTCTKSKLKNIIDNHLN